ncbi:methylenetetrahydrofolate--tRNA-(uracil(54)-C(5))-methyltransferase (FADH(2)-oxidizing) TrmFO [Altererythrobacter sp. KTW20L]|uniref:methylenetetrahydrofolate--tRNA-(uracil(54)- C(5))-methyltransferase (FADH(2)-oxidizing) TrmFO n=1 Tax=Altererythrobacter sp. KTW20L TaxID=2942210 RepID=UPI0020C05564|nr:methylenetetrahydrofolate--tRNA-(uracil(54)-C(5))-methyltransferase (FADH(2)-oxidizing) TrmFO [Altererythrobacter sp. KTW20L]MCL6251977.1 methylenetetrahydrofolate--tRNA-(uracil(54)-C(5))-methyltransferase (FADH(2)-oxidizing) TrmFO [Altererythrobacter sp. KTW20L]
MTYDVHIIGGGLAGSEAAWQLAQRGVKVRLSEMRGGGDGTAAHHTDGLAELVCSNSFRSDDDEKNAVGLLHHEMRRLDSLIMRAGEVARVPAGSAMAVDRDVFSAEVQKALEGHPNVTVVRERVDQLPASGLTVVATGPLTAPQLADSIVAATGKDRLAFFDAIAPIVHHESIDMSICWMAARWDKGGKDYINCPMTREEYYAFVDGLLAAEKGDFKEWEANTPYFDGCMPIEVMAERGRETLRFGPMKPVGLDNPHAATPEFPQGRWPYAVVQLRQDNKLGTLWNMVGFQTKMKYGAQVELFRTIPGLQDAEFARLGGMHRNTFINSPTLLDRQLRLKGAEHIRFAGQVTGCEGYIESAAVGMLAGMMTAAEVQGASWQGPPRTSACGALLAHITGDAEASDYQPMNINFGLFPPLHDVNKKSRKEAYTGRAKQDFGEWLAQLSKAGLERVPA